MNDLQERPALFGSESPLVGVLTLPVSSTPATLACLMFNVGTTHRIGPHRLNVKLARRLAQRGVASLRVDLSGIGDSPSAPAQRNFREQVVRDLQSAIDHVEQITGIRRFVIFGICSGAINGFALALADERVVGAVMFDGYAFPSRRSDWERNWHRFTALTRNPAVMEKAVRWLKRLPLGWRRSTSLWDADSASPTPEEFASDMQLLVDRGVRLYLMFSGTLHVRDRERDQLHALRHTPVAGLVDYDFLPEVDHTVTSIAAQQCVMDAVCSWVDRLLHPAVGAAVATAVPVVRERPASIGLSPFQTS